MTKLILFCIAFSLPDDMLLSFLFIMYVILFKKIE